MKALSRKTVEAGSLQLLRDGIAKTIHELSASVASIPKLSAMGTVLDLLPAQKPDLINRVQAEAERLTHAVFLSGITKRQEKLRAQLLEVCAAHHAELAKSIHDQTKSRQRRLAAVLADAEQIRYSGQAVTNVVK